MTVKRAEPAVGDEADLDDATEHREVDVAAAQHEHDALALEVVELAGEERGERRGAGAFDDALLQLDQAQDRERDRRLVDGDDAVDDALERSRTARRPAARPRGRRRASATARTVDRRVRRRAPR